MTNIPPLVPEIGFNELKVVSANALDVISQVRSAMLAPEARKRPPTFNSAQLAELCGIDKSRLHYLVKKGGLPGGTQGSGNRRAWIARTW